MTLAWHAARYGLFSLSAEAAHNATLRALELGVYPRSSQLQDQRLAQTVFGLVVPNPIGVAAGFDKDARVYNALFSMGFGFAEAGTITPQPQPGNPKPRAFRLLADKAVINRYGFNSQGQAMALGRLHTRPARGLLGINIGANKTSADPIEDYRAGVRTFAPEAAYLAVNISSPNTPGLRDLQAPDRLNMLLEAVMDERAKTAHRVPILVKLAPDVHDGDIAAVVDCVLSHRVDGLILTNTTLARQGLRDSHRDQAGGLSGKPLFRRATRFLAKVYLASGGKLPLIGVGGVDSGRTALAKVRAGASLVQIYTGLVYRGPPLLKACWKTLSQELDRTGAPNLAALTGQDAERWASADL